MPVTQRSRGLWQAPAHSIDNLWAYGSTNTLSTATAASTAWPVAFMIIYVPVRVLHRVKVLKLWYASAVTGTANLQMGVYDQSGARQIGSASTAKVSSADEGVIDVTDTVIGPGLYYIALQHTDATGIFDRTAPTAPTAAAVGVRTETLGSLGLPATATWTVNQTLAYIPFVGMFIEGTMA